MPKVTKNVSRLRVYGWTAHVSQSVRIQLGLRPWIIQARAIVAAKSLAEVGRLVDRPPRQLFNICETGNAREIATALEKPHTVFASALDGPATYHEVIASDVS